MKLIVLCFFLVGFVSLGLIGRLEYKKKPEITVEVDSKSYHVPVEHDDTFKKILNRIGIQVSNLKEIPEIDSFKEGQVIRLESKKQCISLNISSAQELIQIKGIGPRKADAILKYRIEHEKFISVEELLNIKGIGPKLLERIKDSICV
ncbi:helix-hairpin-helix domain-containing protein [Erysipelothrix rhusiopathiae]|nr:helix-hairpin-helix domain-containing protein [Erysipelothrix rhusiopathiae]